MISVPNNVEKFPAAYGYPDVSKQFDRLWDLVWANGGSSTWYRLGNRQVEIFADWWCNNNIFSIISVKGDLPEKYKIKSCGNVIELTLKNRHYQFYSKSNYGHFSVPNSIYLTNGSACYSDRWDDEPIDEFISTPFVNFQGRCHRKKWLMTNEAASEVTAFLSDLCDRIEESRTR